MRKIIVSGIFASLLISTSALAATTTPCTRDNPCTNMPYKSSTTTREVKRGEGIEIQRQNRLTQIVAKTVEQINKAVTRLESITSRLETRISKVKAAGADTAKAEEALTHAKEHFALAKTLIVKLAVLDTSDTNLGQNVSRLRAAVKEVKEHLREGHASLVEALKALPKNNQE